MRRTSCISEAAASILAVALSGCELADLASAGWTSACSAVSVAAAGGIVLVTGLRGRRQRSGLRSELGALRRDNEDQRRRLSAFVDESSDIVMTYTVDGRLQSVDERGERLLNLDVREIAKLSLRDVVAPSFLPIVALSAADCASGRDHWGPLEIQVHSSAGEDVWLLARIRALREAERVWGFELVGTSITNQKNAESSYARGANLLLDLAQVTASQGTMLEVLELIARGIGFEDVELWNVDEQFDVLRLTDRWRASSLPPVLDGASTLTLGKGSRLAGRTWAIAKPLLEPELHHTLGGVDAALEGSFRTGLSFPVRLAGQVVGIVALRTTETSVRMPSIDLLTMLGTQVGQFAQRQRAEERLRSSEARNRAILECTIECVITSNERGQIMDFNPAAERTFGHLRADVLGKPVVDVIVPPELREQHLAAIASYFATGQRRLEGRIETEGLRADGTRIPIEVAVTPVWVGEKPVLTAFLRDISHRKELERLKDELVSTVSHELRTPLASVRGFVELLLLRDYAPQEQKKFLGIIDSELRRLTRLINDFLDLQRLEGGKQIYDTTDRDLVLLLKECIEVATGSSKSHVFLLDASDAALMVRMDADRIRQVVMNLLSNAVKFSPDGGEVRVSAQVRGDYVEASVRDSGLGMSQDVVRKLFAKFYRADSSATRKIQGTGLGLALVREIVTAHGGDVRVESEPGVGSVFSFTLPRALEVKEPA